MIITPDQREAINDILIDAFQSPKYIVLTNSVMSAIELAPSREIPKDLDMSAAMAEEIYRRVFKDPDHKKSARLMCDIMNADEIVRRIEAIK